MFPLNLYARVRILDAHFAHETAGAARTRHSLRPDFHGVTFSFIARAQRAARSRSHIQSSSPGLTGRSSIPETPGIESTGRGVLGRPVKPGDDTECWKQFGMEPRRHVKRGGYRCLPSSCAGLIRASTFCLRCRDAWMAGTSPAMTKITSANLYSIQTGQARQCRGQSLVPDQNIRRGRA